MSDDIFNVFGLQRAEAKAPSPLDKYEHLIPADEDLPWTIYNGDALEVLKTLPDNHFDACYCDPPYGLSERKRIAQYEEAKAEMPSKVFESEFTLQDGSFVYALTFPHSAEDAGLTFNDESFQCLVHKDSEFYRMTIASDCSSFQLDQDFSAFQKDLISKGRVAAMIEVDTEELSDSWSVIPGPDKISLVLQKESFKTSLKKLPSGGFMGKGWDSDVPSAEVWREVLRCLKPGAPLLAFGGTRVWHRLAVNIEDAGFEIRDTFMYVYGSGFPKALDLSKAIDKHLGQDRKVVGTKKGKGGENLNALSRPEGNDSEEAKSVGAYGTGAKQVTIDIDVTEAGSELSSMWEGYKTALKPAWEPIVVAMKPLDGTFAENAIQHGVAGLNIDAGRIGISQNDPNRRPNQITTPSEKGDSQVALGDGLNNRVRQDEGMHSSKGRFPSNFVMTHHPECECVGTKKVKGNKLKYNESDDAVGEGGYSKGWEGRPQGVDLGYTDEDGNETVEAWECHEDCPVRILDEQTENKIHGAGHARDGRDADIAGVSIGYSGGWGDDKTVHRFGDSGGASRFFYTGKASTTEREAGLTPPEDGGRACTHPTVKPIDLNRYFTRMILPPAREDEQRKLLIPFSGVGSEMVGAFKGGWDHVTGIELQEEYVEVAHQRLKWWVYGGGADEFGND